MFEKREEKIREILDICSINKIPFYIFRRPQEDRIFCGIQTSSPYCVVKNEAEWNENGFVMYPFDKGLPLFIKNDLTFTNLDSDKIDLESLKEIDFRNNSKEENTNLDLSNLKYFDYTKHDIEDIVEKSITKIKDKKLTKIVISKSLLINQNNKTKKTNIEIFESLLSTYTNEFVFWVNVPNVTSWMGASPETLLSKKGNVFKTIALAATQKLEKDKKYSNIFSENWDQKEIIEQDIVSKYVEAILKNYSNKNIEQSLPFTKYSGKLLHICTKFKFVNDLSFDKIHQLIKDLHPTPAVCGFPKEKAKKYILELEKHDRSYYSGFLGPVNNKDFELFVNLRSMEVLENSFILFAGCGITVDSVPEKEWDESQAKLQTLLSIIKK